MRAWFIAFQVRIQDYDLKDGGIHATLSSMALKDIENDADLLNLKREKYIIFIDESGDDTFYRNLEIYNNQSVSPCLTILALIIKKENYNALIKEVGEIKQQLFGNKDVVLVSRNIRNRVGDFSIFQEKEVYNIFKNLIVDAIDHSNAIIISCSINKHRLLERKQSMERHSGEYPIDPLYELCCKFMFERVCHFLHRENAKAHFCFEKIGKKESEKMKQFIGTLKCEGSITKTKNEKFGYKKEHYRPVTSYSFPAKSYNIIGTQIADYCAHPFSKRCRYGNTEKENDLFTILKKYIYQGDRNEYGLKEWP